MTADLAALLDLAANATSGTYPEESWWGVEGMTRVLNAYAEAKHTWIDNIDEDAAFIAAANPAVVKALVEEVLALRATVERVTALADEWAAVETLEMLDGRRKAPSRSRVDLRAALEPRP